MSTGMVVGATGQVSSDWQVGLTFPLGYFRCLLMFLHGMEVAVSCFFVVFFLTVLKLFQFVTWISVLNNVVQNIPKLAGLIVAVLAD